MTPEQITAGMRVMFVFSGDVIKASIKSMAFDTSSKQDDRYYHQTGEIIATRHSGIKLRSFDIKWDNNLSAYGKPVWTTWQRQYAYWFELAP